MKSGKVLKTKVYNFQPDEWEGLEPPNQGVLNLKAR